MGGFRFGYFGLRSFLFFFGLGNSARRSLRVISRLAISRKICSIGVFLPWSFSFSLMQEFPIWGESKGGGICLKGMEI
jgi:hypothetical protein